MTPGAAVPELPIQEDKLIIREAEWAKRSAEFNKDLDALEKKHEVKVIGRLSASLDKIQAVVMAVDTKPDPTQKPEKTIETA